MSTVRNWEQGRTFPSMSVYQFGKLLNLYRCSFEDLEQAVKESREHARHTDVDPGDVLN